MTFRRASTSARLYTRLCLRTLFHLVTDRCLSELSPRCGLTTHLDLSWCCSPSLSPPALSSFLSGRGRTLTHLRLGNCPAVDPGVVAIIAKSCPRLREISLAGCNWLRPEDFEPMAALQDIRAINLARTKVGEAQISQIVQRNKQ